MKKYTQKVVTPARKQSVMLTRFRGRVRRGLTRYLTGIDAELDPVTGEILKTYDPDTGELLLDFPLGAIPSTLERKIADVYFMRDRGMAFDIYGDESARLIAAEKLVAYALIRDLAGLCAVNLDVSNTKGWTGRTGQFLKEEDAVMMSFAGIAWAARQGIMPAEFDLRLPLGYFSESISTDWTADWKRISVADTLKWKMSEVVVILNRHSGFIRRVGRMLVEKGSLKWWTIVDLLIEEMQAAREKNSERFNGSNPTPFSLLCVRPKPVAGLSNSEPSPF